MSDREFHLRAAGRLRDLAANTTTAVIKVRLLAQAVEHEQRAGTVPPRGSMNGLRRLATWHRSCANRLDGDERQQRLELAAQIERRAEELEGN